MRSTNPFEHDFDFNQRDFARSSNLSSLEGQDPAVADPSLPDSRHTFGGSLRILYLILGLCLAGLLVRSFYLQVVLGNAYFEKATYNHSRVYVKKALRGVIYDANRDLLVENVPRNDAALIPADLPKIQTERDTLLQQIFLLLQLTPEEQTEVHTKLAASPFSPFPVTLKANIDHETKLALLSQFPENKQGVLVVEDFSRNYLGGPAFSHLLGYLAKISAEKWQNNQAEYLIDSEIGKMGLELFYEPELKGSDGRRKVNVNAKGQLQDTMATTLAEAGCDLQLNLENEFQNKVREILARGVNQSGLTGGAAVVLDPRSGAVRALVSYPDFDNNLFTDGVKGEKEVREFDNLNKPESNQPFLNRTISGVYPPGSTFKLVTATAVLNEGVISSNTYLEAPGQIEIPSWFDPAQKFIYKDWNPAGHGSINVIEALTESSDTFFYKAAGGFLEFKGLGLNKLVDYSHRFGLGTILKIDLASEVSGKIPDEEWKKLNFNESWYLGDTYNFAIGQGYVLTTPLQVANFTAAVANKGTLYRPQVVSEVLNCQAAAKLAPQVLNKDIASPYTLSLVRQGMWQAVNGAKGTARNLKYLNLDIAGKTGTAQFNNNEQEHAWFTAFAPYDKPEIVVTVMLEGGGEGSQTALPLAGEIFRAYFSK